jgi:lipopolysaccharide/colanic/teichoic acid biosynthesis glycosyltransferase
MITSTINSYQPHPSTYSIYKRLLDLIGSLIGILILLIIFLPIAIATKLDSPGPIFYNQKRYGLYGQPFKIWKFRSMIQNAETLKYQIPNQAKGLIFKNDNDPRVTRVGRFLRRTR